MYLQPGEEGGAEVEADPGVVVDDPADHLLVVEDARGGVRLVALVGDPLVPVVERVGRILQLDVLEPGVFPGGLIEMAVDADVSLHTQEASSW
jgi:hypothetical protein